MFSKKWLCLALLAGCGEETKFNEKTPEIISKFTPQLQTKSTHGQIIVMVSPRELISGNFRTVAGRIENGKFKDIREMLLELRSLNNNLGVIGSSYESLFIDIQKYLYEISQTEKMKEQWQYAAEFRKIADWVEKNEPIGEKLSK